MACMRLLRLFRHMRAIRLADQSHASHKEAVYLTRREKCWEPFSADCAISAILRLVRRPYGLHAIGPQDHAIIQTHGSHKARGPITTSASSSILMRQPHKARGPITKTAWSSILMRQPLEPGGPVASRVRARRRDYWGLVRIPESAHDTLQACLCERRAECVHAKNRDQSCVGKNATDVRGLGPR
jgi:hypothetical protein